MIVEKTAAKKTLAVTLALALGLSFPGVALSQVVGAVGSAAAGSEAAVSAIAGAQTVTLNIAPAIGMAPIAATWDPAASPAVYPAAAAPQAAAPAAAIAAPQAVEAHPVIALINQLQKAGISLPDAPRTRADAARVEEAAQALPAGSPARASLMQLAASIRASGSADDAGRAFDGSAPAAGAASVSAPAPASGMLSRLARLLPSSLRGKGAAPEAAQPVDPKSLELGVNDVRYAPVAEKLPESTREVSSVNKQIVGQDDALKAIRFALEMTPAHYNLYVAGAGGSGRSLALRHILSGVAPKMAVPGDLVAVTNFGDKDQPIVLELAPGKGAEFAAGVESFVEAMKRNLPTAVAGGEVGQKKQQIMARVQASQHKRQADFDAKVKSIRLAGKFGVYFSAGQGENGVKIVLGVTHDGLPMSRESVETKIADGAFTQAEWEQAQSELQEKKGGILEAYQAMMTANLSEIQKVQQALAGLDQKAAVGLINQYASELAQSVAQGLRTPAEKAFEERARERDAEINEALQALAGKTFGKFGVALQAGMGPDGMPIVAAAPAFGKTPLVEDAAAEKLIASGAFTKAEYEAAKAQIARSAKAIQDKAAEFVAQTNKERESLPATKPGPRERKLVGYIQSLANFAAANYKIFLGAIKDAPDGVKPMPGSRPIDPEDFFRVSVLTDNGAAKGAPVVWENNPTYERLFGSADGNQRNMIIPGVGVVKTDGPGGPSFKAGSFLRANGGFLVLRAMDALKSPGVWPALMNAVRTGQAEIAEGGLAGMASMKGAIYRVPAKVKVVLIGSPTVQMLLAQHDEDFASNFQGIAQFQPTIKITEEAVGGFLNFLKHAVVGSAGEVMDLTRDAIVRVLEHAARLADSHNYFTAQFGALQGLLQESTYWAQRAGRTEIRGEDVDAALQAKSEREDVHVKRMMELYQNNVFRVETSGSAVGQINGLAVMGSFGVPMRITFVAGPGAPGLVSVDHQAGTTGSSFNKALGNEWSYLVNEFGQNKAMKVQIRVSHEQNYGGIDGDSATSTAIYGMLSALSGVPIRQNFAVTGSADQFGNVQAIGGANEKIEGFFQICKHRGLTGDQGVVLPRANVGDLQLSPEVAQAIKDGKFHIYAVDNVRQGIEILTGVSYQTIKTKAEARLAEIAKAK